MDWELFSSFVLGLIGIIGCVSGEVQIWLWLGQYDEVWWVVVELCDIFGVENYYVEIMDYGIGIEWCVIGDFIWFVKDFDLLLFVINDLYYMYVYDLSVYEILLCVQLGLIMEDFNCFCFEGNEFYLKIVVQMWQLFLDYFEVCDNIFLIVECCEVEFVKCDLMLCFLVFEGEIEVSWFE